MPPNKSGDVYTSGGRSGTESTTGGVDPSTGHQTQVYPDNYRESRDGYGDWHWTNQNVPKGDSGRHTPPSDAQR